MCISSSDAMSMMGLWCGNTAYVQLLRAESENTRCAQQSHVACEHPTGQLRLGVQYVDSLFVAYSPPAPST